MQICLPVKPSISRKKLFLADKKEKTTDLSAQEAKKQLEIDGAGRQNQENRIFVC